MSYVRTSEGVNALFEKGLADTVEKALEIERNVEYKPLTINELNANIKKEGFGDNAITDKFTPEEKQVRKERYQRLHEQYVTYSAKAWIAKDKVANHLKEQQLDPNDPEKRIVTNAGERYPEQLIFDFSGTDEAFRHNVDVAQTFIDAKNIGDNIDWEARQAKEAAEKNGQTFDYDAFVRDKEAKKTPEEKSIEAKFNRYHQELFDKISKYPLEEIRSSIDDDSLVKNAIIIYEAAHFGGQIENIRKLYKNAHITMPPQMQEQMQQLAVRCNVFAGIGKKMNMIDSPYYEEVDVSDGKTLKAIYDYESFTGNDDLLYTQDNNYPVSRRLDSEIAAFSTALFGFEATYKGDELFALRQAAEKLGIPACDLAVQVGDGEPKPYLQAEFRNNPSVSFDDLDKLYSHEISKITLFDKFNPERKLELSGDVNRNFTFASLLAEASLLAQANHPGTILPELPEQPKEPEIPEKPIEPEKPAEPEKPEPIKLEKPGRFKRFLSYFMDKYKKEVSAYDREAERYANDWKQYEQAKEKHSEALKEYEKDYKKYEKRQKDYPEECEEYEKEYGEYQKSYDKYKKDYENYRSAVKKLAPSDEKFKEVTGKVGLRPKDQPMDDKQMQKVQTDTLKAWVDGASMAGAKNTYVNEKYALATKIAEGGARAFQIINEAAKQYQKDQTDVKIDPTVVQLAGTYQMFYNQNGKLIETTKDMYLTGGRGTKKVVGGPYEELGNVKPSTAAFKTALEQGEIGKTGAMKISEVLKMMGENGGKIFPYKAVAEFKKNYADAKKANYRKNFERMNRERKQMSVDMKQKQIQKPAIQNNLK